MSFEIKTPVSAQNLRESIFSKEKLSAQQYSNISCSDQVGVIKKNTQEREHLTQPEKTFNDNDQHCHITLALGPAACLGSQSSSLANRNRRTAKPDTNH